MPINDHICSVLKSWVDLILVSFIAVRYHVVESITSASRLSDAAELIYPVQQGKLVTSELTITATSLK